MFDDTNLSSRLCAAIGATAALFATFLPWYSYEVVLPTTRTIHVFTVTATLWGLETLAPILIVVGAVVSLVLVGAAVPGRILGAIVGLIGLAILVYGIVRCFDIPNLGVVLLSPVGAARLSAITQLEGGPFVELGGGALILLGGIGAMASRWVDVPVEVRPSSTGWSGNPSTPHTA
ncbi:MAG: hypothetical protein JWM60_1209 [Solirubrobacterales bacterium]|jgi:hypothetical protein|nr:hypothetical protein [Solirubrobacterales bacterium]